MLRVVSRASPLAVYQANEVITLLEKKGVKAELVTRTTSPDRHLNQPLSDFDKYSFTKEIDQALLDGDADVAVHSAKDMGVMMPQGVSMVGCLPAHQRHDVLVTLPNALPLSSGARVGLGGIRREHQLKHHAAHFKAIPIRGNIARRLSYLEHECDAIVMAKAAIVRLKLHHDYQLLDLDWVPAANQGIIATTMLENHPHKALLESLMHAKTTEVMTFEKTLVAYLGADCQMPLGICLQEHSLKGYHLSIEWFFKQHRFYFNEYGGLDQLMTKAREGLFTFKDSL